MSDHPVQFEASDRGLVLSTAILLYRNANAQSVPIVGAPRDGSPAFATIHGVDHRDGRPTIAAGAPLTRAHLRQWTEALGRNVAPEILPGNVLVAHPDMLAWWVPERVRSSYFALTATKGLKALTGRTVLPLPYPAHLFIASSRGLGVYALPTSERPTAETIVLHSPVLNVFIDGQLCWGNIPRPKSIGTATMAEFESAVFDSWSTHPNHGQEATVTGKDGLVRLWDDLAARKAKRFPVKRLRPFYPSARRPAGAAPITLGKLIAGGAQA